MKWFAESGGERANQGKPWDIAIIGGGATGVGVAVDADSSAMA